MTHKQLRKVCSNNANLVFVKYLDTQDLSEKVYVKYVEKIGTKENSLTLYTLCYLTLSKKQRFVLFQPYLFQWMFISTPEPAGKLPARVCFGADALTLISILRPVKTQ